MEYGIFDLFLWIFALYGLYMLEMDLIECIFHQGSKVCEKAEVVLTVKDSAESIENTVREMDFQNRMMKGKLFDRIRIINLDSNDETSLIIEKLSEDYPYIVCQSKQN